MVNDEKPTKLALLFVEAVELPLLTLPQVTNNGEGWRKNTH